MTLASSELGTRRRLYVYRRQLGAHFRAALEYETDFWLLVVGGALTQLVGVVFVFALFEQVPDLNGWTKPEVVIMFAMVVLAEGIGSLFFNGIWWIAWEVNDGHLDYRLTRPYPVFFQIAGREVGLNGFGNLITGTILLVWGLANADIDWSPATIALGIVLFISAVAIKQAITTVSNSASFWLEASSVMLAFGVHQVGDLAKYPISVYAWALQVTLTVVVPFTFISFFPAAAILGKGNGATVGLLTPLVAIASLVLARWVFNRGLARYESTGS